MNATSRPIYKSKDVLDRSPKASERLKTHTDELMNDYANDYTISPSNIQSQMVNRSRAQPGLGD